MALLPAPQDPTLTAIDREIEARQSRRGRTYLGMSEIGGPCERALWYSFRWTSYGPHDAASLKRFEDGHASEAQQSVRLRQVSGIRLLTVDPEDGQQWGLDALGGHFRGHLDGAILGILQAPTTWHVWEHKAVDPKKQTALEKFKRELGEKSALAAWNAVYYAQAVLYMHFSGMERHYLTASSPGGRHTVSVRTNADPIEAIRLTSKAERIIDAPRPPSRISDDPSWHECRFCRSFDICHGGQFSDRNCRTCLHSSPIADGWRCTFLNQDRSIEEQRAGCPQHRFVPDLVPGTQEDAAPDASWILYRLKSGEWRDEGQTP